MLKPAALLLAFGMLGTAHAQALSHDQAVAALRKVDQLEYRGPEYKALLFLVSEEKNRDPVAHEIVVNGRGDGSKLLIMFTKPKTEEGQGYLEVDRNLWFYDPSTGRWDRRTERDKIGGTGATRRDFENAHYAELYDPVSNGTEVVDGVKTRWFELKAKPGVEVAYPKVRVWVSQVTSLPLQVKEFADSGRLLRSTEMKSWRRATLPGSTTQVFFAGEIDILDELDHASKSTILVKAVDFKPLPQNLFTKAWVESKSR